MNTTPSEHISLRISRYTASPTWSMAVEPDDRSWTLFVPKVGKPLLFDAVAGEMVAPAASLPAES